MFAFQDKIAEVDERSSERMKLRTKPRRPATWPFMDGILGPCGFIVIDG